MRLMNSLRDETLGHNNSAMKTLVLACLLSLLLGRVEAAVRDLGQTCSRTNDSCVHPEQKLVCDRLTSTCVLAVHQSCGRHGQTSVGTKGLCVSGASCSGPDDGLSVCTCGTAGYTPTDGYCDIGAEMYGGPCNGDDCFDHTLTCRTTTDTVKRCDCVKGRKPDIVTATCTENFMFKGALCNVRADCSSTNGDAYECVNGSCECALGYNALYNEECVEITDLVAGKRCDQNSGSGCGDRNVTHLQCSPADGVCTCVGGYVGLTGNECYPAAGELNGGCTASTPGTQGSCLRQRNVCIQDDIDRPLYCQDLCLLPKVTGMCRAYFPSFYYNSKTGACEKFVYGGCQGNSNRFTTKDECEQTCVDDTCQLSKKAGPCEAYMPSYFYNRETGACEQFIYGGCQGNDNRFGTKEECQAACVRDMCELPPEPGMCMAYFPKYFYNSTSEVCEEFVYGGCGGNDNNFDNQTQCEKTCGKVKDVCELPPESGMCMAYFPKYFYNSTSEACEEFIYGGCQGNDNRFDNRTHCEKSCSKDICRLPKDTGPCRASIPRFFYNWETGACEKFIYGGCQGNENRFETEEDCRAACVTDVCQLPRITGPCRASIPSYFYNSETGACEKFTYGGCEGNDNRFETEEECQAACVKDVCELPPESGMCMAYFPKYFYNSTSEACEEFIYGGCQGNDNRFDNKTHCEKSCGKDICRLPKDTGPCRASIPRFFYNWQTGACEQFIYGGCQGNENRFETEEECQAACVTDVCQLPRITGPCRASIPSYFYNSETGACEKFTYGGCEGNSNRFGTKGECQAACVKDKCQLPKEAGPCEAYMPSYFYNRETGACEQFIYGGCQGNDNRFGTEEDCRAACVKDKCQLPKEAGPCKAYMPSYFYNRETGACEQFIYGGCKGNDNRFGTEEDCRAACVKDPCQQPKQPGKCRGYFPRYFYNSASKTCEEFVYGGCGGNKNNFESLRDCRHACQKEMVCRQPKRSGRCEAFITRYFYNTEANECEDFIYGGCGGNDNNFAEKIQCQLTCRRDTDGSSGLHSQIVMVMLAVIVGWSFIRL